MKKTIVAPIVFGVLFLFLGGTVIAEQKCTQEQKCGVEDAEGNFVDCGTDFTCFDYENGNQEEILYATGENIQWDKIKTEDIPTDAYYWIPYEQLSPEQIENLDQKHIFSDATALFTLINKIAPGTSFHTKNINCDCTVRLRRNDDNSFTIYTKSGVTEGQATISEYPVGTNFGVDDRGRIIFTVNNPMLIFNPDGTHYEYKSEPRLFDSQGDATINIDFTPPKGDIVTLQTGDTFVNLGFATVRGPVSFDTHGIYLDTIHPLGRSLNGPIQTLEYDGFKFTQGQFKKYIFSITPRENFNQVYAVIDQGKLLGARTVFGSELFFEIPAGNEQFSTFITEIGYGTPGSYPDTKALLQISIQNGDGFDIFSPFPEIPQFRHFPSKYGQTLIQNGEIPIIIDKDGVHTDVGKGSTYYATMNKRLRADEFGAFLASLRNSVAMEIVSNAHHTEITRIGSANTLLTYTNGDRNKILVDAGGLPISLFKKDNAVKSVYDLERLYPSINFYESEITPFTVQATHHFLQTDYKGVVSDGTLQQIILVPEAIASAGVDIGSITIGEMMIKAWWLAGSAPRIGKHEFTHLGDRMTELFEETWSTGDSFYDLNEDIAQKIDAQLVKSNEFKSSIDNIYQFIQDKENRKKLGTELKKIVAFESRADADGTLTNDFYDVNVDQISEEQILKDLDLSLQAMKKGNGGQKITLSQLESWLGFASRSESGEITNVDLYQLRLDLHNAVKSTIGTGRSYISYTPRELTAVFNEFTFEEVSEKINSQNSFIRDTFREILQVQYDAERVDPEFYYQLMNSIDMGDPRGSCDLGVNCYCDVNPSQCGKCLIYKSGVCYSGPR